MKRQNGFTLAEMLIYLAIAVVFGMIGFINLSGVKSGQDLDSDVKKIFSALGDARERSVTQTEEGRWGIYFTDLASGRDYYEMFKGSYPGGVVSRTTLNPSVEFYSLASPQVVFTKLSGTTTPATITVRAVGKSCPGTQCIPINVNSYGAVDY